MRVASSVLLCAALALAGAEEKMADDCVFLHGLGVDGSLDNALFMDVAYWLDLKPAAEAMCNRTHFPVFDTVHRGAGNFSLQDDFFGVASLYQGPRDRVFAHSMGNNILARACLDQGKCLARGWFQAHGPITGSVFPDLLAAWCPPSGSGFPEQLAGWVGKLVGYCTPATYSLQTCDHKSPQKHGSEAVCGGERELEVVGRMTRHGVMCGTSGFGITSVLSPLLDILDVAFARPLGYAPDDGMVSLSSCAATLDAWAAASGANASLGEAPTGRYYRAATNHADGMGFSGDGLVGDDRKPLTWFKSMIAAGWLP